MTSDTGKVEREKKQADVAVFLLTNSTRDSKQGETFLGVIPDDTTLQVTTHQEFAKLLMSRQQQKAVSSGKLKMQLNSGG